MGDFLCSIFFPHLAKRHSTAQTYLHLLMPAIFAIACATLGRVGGPTYAIAGYVMGAMIPPVISTAAVMRLSLSVAMKGRWVRFALAYWAAAFFSPLGLLPEYFQLGQLAFSVYAALIAAPYVVFWTVYLLQKLFSRLLRKS